jgi:predicted lysophospholipase L1 biosynthesis ABC-type transport system permease subunit
VATIEAQPSCDFTPGLAPQRLFSSSNIEHSFLLLSGSFFHFSYLMARSEALRKKKDENQGSVKNEGERWNCFRNEEGTLDCDIKILLFFLLFLIFLFSVVSRFEERAFRHLGAPSESFRLLFFRRAWLSVCREK